MESIVSVIGYVFVGDWKLDLEARLFLVSPICGLLCAFCDE